MKKVITILSVLLIGVAFAWNGGGTTQPNSGDYWAFTPGDQPPQAPHPSGLAVPDPEPFDYYDIHDAPGAIQVPPLTGAPYIFTLPSDVDFWFYGTWYYHGSKLYVYPDGMMAFVVPNTTDPQPTGDLTDPTKPNAVIAPYWTDLNADGTGDTKRIYIWKDKTNHVLVFQWYEVEDADGNVFNFSAALWYGDEALLIDEGCGVIFSAHYIDFAYQNGYDWGDEDPNAEVGIENAGETTADHYYVIIPHEEAGEDIIENRATIRFYYRKIFDYDMAVDKILAPHNVVLRHTKYAPVFVTQNIGTEVVSSYNVSIDITDLSTGDNVYSKSFSRTQLYYAGSGEDWKDTITCEPVWDRPGEIGTEYEIKIQITGYAQDECVANNTYYDTVKVWCEEEYSYLGKYSIFPLFWWDSDIEANAYALPDGKAIVMGGDAFLYWTDGDETALHLVAYSGDDVADADWTEMTVRKYNDMEHEGFPDVPAKTWNEIYFQYGPMKWQRLTDDNKLEWVAGYDLTGQIGVIGVQNDASTVGLAGGSGAGCVGGAFPDIYEDPGVDLSADGAYTPGSINWLPWSGDVYFYGITMKTHLALWKPPVAPAYYEKAHDLAVVSVLTPEKYGTGYYVEAEKAITPKDTIANLGRQKEETSTTYPIQAFFRAVPELEGFDTYETSTNIPEIDWIGGTGDFTKEVAFADWTPEGNCDYGDAKLIYDAQYIVKRNKVGPDKTDHCPYNDTVHLSVISLWKYDAWMKEIHVYKNEMGGEEAENGEHVPVDTKLYFKCVVANTGINVEPHDIGGSKARFVAQLQVIQDDNQAVVFGPSIEPITYLNWRGNTSGEPWETEVEFPDYWTVPDDKTYKIEFKVELDGDKCSKNNSQQLYIGGVAANIPREFRLYRIDSPAKEVVVKYALPVKTHVDIKVYDVTGKLVKTLVSETEEAGYGTITWNGTDARGRTVSSGVYYVKMVAGDYNGVQKVILMK